MYAVFQLPVIRITGCSLGAKASGLGPEDRGFKSLHPDSLFLAIYRLIKLIILRCYALSCLQCYSFIKARVLKIVESILLLLKNKQLNNLQH